LVNIFVTVTMQDYIFFSYRNARLYVVKKSKLDGFIFLKKRMCTMKILYSKLLNLSGGLPFLLPQKREHVRVASCQCLLNGITWDI
jgi:hypothetical protein